MSKVKTTIREYSGICLINQTRIDPDKLSLPDLEKTVSRLNIIFGFAADQPLEIILAEKSDMKAINLKYRQKNQPTDVLSFPQHFYDKFPENILGTIILCPAVIREQEGMFHLLPYLIHGYLHLMGYDHETKKDQIEWDKTHQAIDKLIGNNI